MNRFSLFERISKHTQHQLEIGRI